MYDNLLIRRELRKDLHYTIARFHSRLSDIRCEMIPYITKDSQHTFYLTQHLESMKAYMDIKLAFKTG